MAISLRLATSSLRMRGRFLVCRGAARGPSLCAGASRAVLWETRVVLQVTIARPPGSKFVSAERPETPIRLKCSRRRPDTMRAMRRAHQNPGATPEPAARFLEASLVFNVVIHLLGM